VIAPAQYLKSRNRKNAQMSSDLRVKAIRDIETALLFDIVVDLNPRLNIGDGPLGRRIFFGAAGGTFAGPKLHGKVLPGGGDWALFRPDGTMTLDVRLTLQMHEGALVYMTYGGRWVIPPNLRADITDPAKRYQVDPAKYYFRTTPLFETGDQSYAWLNDIVCIGSGYLVEGAVAYRVSQVL
jgi:hypothetical protein